jgi:hypothetical protein
MLPRAPAHAPAVIIDAILLYHPGAKSAAVFARNTPFWSLTPSRSVNAIRPSYPVDGRRNPSFYHRALVIYTMGGTKLLCAGELLVA